MISNPIHVQAILKKLTMNEFLSAEYQKGNLSIEVGEETFVTIKPLLFIDGEPAETTDRKQKIHNELVRAGFEYRMSHATQEDHWRVYPEGYYMKFSNL